LSSEPPGPELGSLWKKRRRGGFAVPSRKKKKPLGTERRHNSSVKVGEERQRVFMVRDGKEALRTHGLRERRKMYYEWNWSPNKP